MFFCFVLSSKSAFCCVSLPGHGELLKDAWKNISAPWLCPEWEKQLEFQLWMLHLWYRMCSSLENVAVHLLRFFALVLVFHLFPILLITAQAHWISCSFVVRIKTGGFGNSGLWMVSGNWRCPIWNRVGFWSSRGGKEVEKKLLLSTCGVPAAPGSVDSPKELFCCIPARLKGKENKKQTGRVLGLHGRGGGHLKPIQIFISI